MVNLDKATVKAGKIYSIFDPNYPAHNLAFNLACEAGREVRLEPEHKRKAWYWNNVNYLLDHKVSPWGKILIQQDLTEFYFICQVVLERKLK